MLRSFTEKEMWIEFQRVYLIPKNKRDSGNKVFTDNGLEGALIWAMSFYLISEKLFMIMMRKIIKSDNDFVIAKHCLEESEKTDFVTENKMREKKCWLSLHKVFSKPNKWKFYTDQDFKGALCWMSLGHSLSDLIKNRMFDKLIESNDNAVIAKHCLKMAEDIDA